ncbi:class I SAM-dependent methyltransferase [Mycoplasmopsis edwardii]|nr:class I SAM-dependent methyltransferase [Mycoplasmopsis edwardii]
MNNNNKKVFHNWATLLKYGNATLNIKLWASEKHLLKKYIKQSATILDLGCGSGRTTFALYENGYQNIIAADISEAMIEQANWINQKLNYPIDFQVQDATNLKFQDNQFDFVFFSFNGWPGIPSQKERIKALSEIYRVLKKGGIFIFSAHERDEEKYLANYKKVLNECNEFKFETFGDYIFKNEENFCDFMHLYSLEELKNLILSNTKFKILETLNRDQNFKESNEVLKFSDNTTFWILQK